MSQETQLHKLMRILDISEKEAMEVMAFDKAVDKMKDKEVNADLNPEQQKAAKKARQADRKPTVFKFDKDKPRRKENPTKAAIIAEIAHFLQESSENAVENVEITNKERIIDFKIGDSSYSLTLTQHRKPKN